MNIDYNYCKSENGDFSVNRLGAMTVLRRLNCDDSCISACIEKPEEHLSRCDHIVKDSRTTKAGLLTLDNGSEIFIKRYNNKGFRYSLRYLFRAPRAFRAWKSASVLERLGVPTPRVLAAVALRETWILRFAYLFCEALPEVMPTLDFFPLLIESKELLNEYVNTVAGHLVKMHQAGFKHGDLKMSNIYAQKSGGDFIYGFWDLDGAKFYGRPLGEKEVISELARWISSYLEIAARLGNELDKNVIAAQVLHAYVELAQIDLKIDLLMARIAYFRYKDDKRKK